MKRMTSKFLILAGTGGELIFSLSL